MRLEEKMDMGEMMSRMMEGCSPDMMMNMMPRCLGMVFQQIPQEKRGDFALKALSTIMKEGVVGLSEKEKREFRDKVSASVQDRD